MKLRFREIVICLKSHGSKLHGLDLIPGFLDLYANCFSAAKY